MILNKIYKIYSGSLLGGSLPRPIFLSKKMYFWEPKVYAIGTQNARKRDENIA